MSFTTGADLTPWQSAVSISTITFTGLNVPVGSLVVFGWCANVASLTCTVSDDSTSPGPANKYVLRPVLPGTTFTAQTIICFKVTREIQTGDTITVALTGGPVTRSVGTGSYWTPSNNNAQLENRSSVSNDTTSPVAAPVMITTQWVSNELGILMGYWKGGAVGSGSTNSSANMPGSALHTAFSSGGTTTRVEARLADSVTMTTTAWTPSMSYTSITVACSEGLTFTDHVINDPACVQFHSFPRGAAVSSSTFEIAPCTAGNLLLLTVCTNENAGADNINTPAGWNVAGTARVGTTTVNQVTFSRISDGTETSVTVTSSVAQRMQGHWSEWFGFTEAQDGAPSTAGNTGAVTTFDSGTVTPSGANRLFYSAVVEKNGAAMTEGGGFTELRSNNEAPGTLSTQKVTLGIYVDGARSAAAREQPTCGTACAFGGMGFLFLPEEHGSPFVSSRVPFGLVQRFSRVFGAFDNPAPAVPGYVLTTQSRAALDYRAPPAVIANAYTPNAPDAPSMVQLALGRRDAAYVGSPSVVVNAMITPTAPITDAWASMVQGRVPPFYHAPASLLILATESSDRAYAAVFQSTQRFPREVVSSTVIDADTLVVSTDTYAAVFQGAVPGLYLGSPSLVIPAVQDTSPPWASVIQNFFSEPVRGRSSFMLAADNTAVTPDTYAGVFQSRVQAGDVLRSLVVAPFDFGAVSGYAAVFRSRQALLGRVAAMSRFIVGAPVPVDGYVPVAQSRGTLARVAVHSLAMMPISEGAVIVTPAPNTGGGGEWIIWTRPDFPANRRGAFPEFNRPTFRKPTRRVP